MARLSLVRTLGQTDVPRLNQRQQVWHLSTLVWGKVQL